MQLEAKKLLEDIRQACEEILVPMVKCFRIIQGTGCCEAA